MWDWEGCSFKWVGFTEVTFEKYLKEMMEPVMPTSGGRAFPAEGMTGAMVPRPVVFEELHEGQCARQR